MTLTVTPSGTGLEWKNLFKTVTIEIGTAFEYIYGSKDKCVFVVQRDENNQTILSVYDAKNGALKDSRTYSHYFNSFIEQDGYIYMSYYSWGEQIYLQGRVMSNAGITGVTEYRP